MFDIKQKTVGDSKNPPIVKSRDPKGGKMMKMALALDGSHIYYNGHSNYGLGPNFNPGNSARINDFLNITGRGITAINYEGMKDPDHGGSGFTVADNEAPAQATNYNVPRAGVTKFAHIPANATVTKKQHQTGAGAFPYHYTWQGNDLNYNTIVLSSGDLPQLKYKSCFMASCNTGRHFIESLSHGVYLFSRGGTYASIGKEGKIEGDLTTDDKSWGNTHWVRLMVEGKSWADIVTFFNDNQWNPDGKQLPKKYLYATFKN